MNEFFVGYLPKVPSGMLGLLKRTILGVVVGTVLLATIVVGSQQKFPASNFEFNQVRNFEGTIEEHPYPALLVRRSEEGRDSYSRYLLVSEGKHGADDQVSGFDGKRVTLRGKLIYRGNDTAIEVMPNSVAATGKSPATISTLDFGPATLTGAIVDTKCYLGVMNPGEGKVHRDCATRCISGGIPPAFMVRQSDGQQIIYVLTDPDGKRVSPGWASDHAARLITLRGRIIKSGNTLIFQADLKSFQLADSGLFGPGRPS